MPTEDVFIMNSCINPFNVYYLYLDEKSIIILGSCYSTNKIFIRGIKTCRESYYPNKLKFVDGSIDIMCMMILSLKPRRGTTL